MNFFDPDNQAFQNAISDFRKNSNKMLSFDRLCKQKKNFSRLTGVTVDEFREIVRKVTPKWEAFQKRKKVSGRCSKLKTLEDEVLLVLIYYRFYVSFQFLEYLFGLDESNGAIA